MRLVIPQLDVAEGDSFRNDALGRQGFGEALLNLVVRSSDELVVALHGQWGEGKTTFVRMWRGLLSEADVPNIYIDAYANDYLDDAFVVVASAITNYAETHVTKDNHKKLVELKAKTKKVGGRLLSWSARMGIRAVTLGIVKESDIDELKDIKADISRDVSKAVGDIVEEHIRSHANDVALIESFRGILSSLPSAMQNEGKGNPLIVIVDELDRCRPTFAVELLEKIKHLFSTKNVIFVLVMNRTQLEESIRSVYGQSVDANTYLQKFINLETQLPKRSSERYDNDINKYARRLLQLHELVTWGDDRNILDCLEPLSIRLNLSLRQLERVFTNLAVLYGTSAENHLRLVPLIVFLAVVKVIDPSLFDDLLRQQLSYKQVASRLGLLDLVDNEREHKLYWIMAWVRYALLTKEEFDDLSADDELKGFGRSLWQYNITREALIPVFAQQLNMFEVR